MKQHPYLMRCSTPLGERIGFDWRQRFAGTDEEAAIPLAAARSSVRDIGKRLRRIAEWPANEPAKVLAPVSLSELSSSSDGR